MRPHVGRHWMLLSYFIRILDRKRDHVHHTHEILDALDVCEPFCAAFTDVRTWWRLDLFNFERSSSWAPALRMRRDNYHENNSVGE